MKLWVRSPGSFPPPACPGWNKYYTGIIMDFKYPLKLTAITILPVQGTNRVKTYSGTVIWFWLLPVRISEGFLV
jgi:hypothetical protein